MSDPRRPLVLLVEDNADHRHGLATLLRRAGFDVEEAADGEEGLAKAVARLYDAAVLDIGLPGLGGYDLANYLRTAWGPAARLAAFTGYGAPDDLARAVEVGFDAHFVKGCNPARLVDWLRWAIRPVG